MFHIVEDLPSPHQSIQDICHEPASSQIPRVWLLWAWISRSVTQVLANLLKLSSVHFRFSPTMQGSRTAYGWPYHASSRHRTHARTHPRTMHSGKTRRFPRKVPWRFPLPCLHCFRNFPMLPPFHVLRMTQLPALQKVCFRMGSGSNALKHSV